MANIVLLTGFPGPREEAGINGVSEGSLLICLGPKVVVASWARLLPPTVAQTVGGGAASHNPLCRGEIQQRPYRRQKPSTCITCVDARRS